MERQMWRRKKSMRAFNDGMKWMPNKQINEKSKLKQNNKKEWKETEEFLRKIQGEIRTKKSRDLKKRENQVTDVNGMH